MECRCKICKNLFETKTSGSKFCGISCWEKAHSHKCLKCDNIFICKDKRRYCSRSCQASMPRKPGCKISTCQNCNKSFDNGYEKRRKFCSKLCSAKFYAHDRKITDWTKVKAKERFTGVDSILRINPVQRNRVLSNLDIGCSRCGWKESICDIHHIYGRKIQNADSHENITYLCPNCHRLAEKKKIGVNDFQSFALQVGEKWRDAYL